ncbi:MAG: hypothetical protein ACPHF2_10055 [Crocinitomicaceae bacterium]
MDKLAALRTLQNALVQTKDAECQTEIGYDIVEEIMAEPVLINELLRNIHQRINITYISTPPRGKKVAIKQPRDVFSVRTESCNSTPSKRSRLTEDIDDELLASPLLSVDSEQFHVIMDDTQIRKVGRPLPEERKKQMDDAVEYILSERAKGYEPKVQAVANEYGVARSTLCRRLVDANNEESKTIKQTAWGRPDRRCLRQTLYNMYIQRHGGDVITTQQKFKGVTTDEMVAQLTPESRTKLRPLGF